MGSIFGVTGHFLHNDIFYPQYPDYWRLEKTLPKIKDLGMPVVAEGIYGLNNPTSVLVSKGSTDPAVRDKMAACRQQVSDWLSLYDGAGAQIIITPVGFHPTWTGAARDNDELSSWIAELVAAHPCVVAVQMHNEPHLSSYGGFSSLQYVQTFKPYADKVHAARPGVKVLGGAASSLWWPNAIAWTKGCLDLGMLDWVDGIVVHPYNEDFAPEIDPHWRGAPITDLNQREGALRAYWAMVQGYNFAAKPLSLWFSEFGWNTALKTSGHVNEQQQADFLTRSYMIFMDVRLRGVPLEAACWYDLKDDGDLLKYNPPSSAENAQHRYGLMNYDMSRNKPAYAAFKAMKKFFDPIDDFEPVCLVASVLDPLAKLKTWRKKSTGAYIVAFWNTDTVIEPCKQNLAWKLNIGLPSASSVKQYHADKSAPGARSFAVVDGQLQISGLKYTTRASWLEIVN